LYIKKYQKWFLLTELFTSDIFIGLQCRFIPIPITVYTAGTSRPVPIVKLNDRQSFLQKKMIPVFP